ncbi:hypothetical protein C2E31_15065 [Rhodopirellula baltica]|nr:hypothetical protein C2E31_15065 [Rhodopirellula baltica]
MKPIFLPNTARRVPKNRRERPRASNLSFRGAADLKVENFFPMLGKLFSKSGVTEYLTEMIRDRLQ